MKRLLSFLFVLFVIGSVYAAEPDSLLLVENSFRNPTFDKDNCTCKGKNLYGKVKVVSSGADFRVQVVDTWEDIDVKVVNEWADSCGKWKFVDENSSWYDFTIEYVSSYPDFKIKFVNTWAGTK